MPLEIRLDERGREIIDSHNGLSVSTFVMRFVAGASRLGG